MSTPKHRVAMIGVETHKQEDSYKNGHESCPWL